MDDPTKGIGLKGTIWMVARGENLGGHGRIELLALIEECGSITQAAKRLGMSYKAAWDAVDAMNNLAGESIVLTASGGKGGGGTKLTARGRNLVENFRVIEREHKRFVAALGDQARGLADDYLLIRRLGMKTSARNHFRGRVTAIKLGAVNDEIELEVAGGHRIVAIVTSESTEGLGLEVGSEAFALVKSSSIIIMTDDDGARISARNRFSGTVARIKPGAVNAEVAIGLPGGTTIAAIITNESAAAMGLATGLPATAIFKASSVIIGVPA